MGVLSESVHVVLDNAFEMCSAFRKVVEGDSRVSKGGTQGAGADRRLRFGGIAAGAKHG